MVVEVRVEVIIVIIVDLTDSIPGAADVWEAWVWLTELLTDEAICWPAGVATTTGPSFLSDQL